MGIKVFLFFYSLAWFLLLPLITIYLLLRSKHQPLYRKHILERFGKYNFELPENPIWVHAVSIGELRSALVLIRGLLAGGEKILLTVFTPAARSDAEKQFSEEIKTGELTVIWVPFDMKWCHRRLLRNCKPKICLPLEVEIWPNMIWVMKLSNIPLYLCNSQYAVRSMQRDNSGLKIRQRIIALCAGALVKSDAQRARFAQIGLRNIIVTGELRFDQKIPHVLAHAALLLRKNIKREERTIITIASGTEKEEQIYMQMILRMKEEAQVNKVLTPLFIYVPRAPERFDQVGLDLQAAGLNMQKRSTLFEEGLVGLSKPKFHISEDIDVLLGDSLGEMYFYLSSADKVVIGGGFSPRGAHNIIEPLAVGKPVFVGPYTWTIEFPFVEASEHMIAKSLPTVDDMINELSSGKEIPKEKISEFMKKHRGASQRTVQAVYDIIGSGPITKHH